MTTQYDKTGEIDMLFEMFEKNYKTSSVHVRTSSWDRYKRSEAPKGHYYHNGEVNNLFVMFLCGYELGRCNFRD